MGEPNVGVVFEEKAGFENAGDGVGRHGAGTEGAHSAVGVERQENDESDNPKKTQERQQSLENWKWTAGHVGGENIRRAGNAQCRMLKGRGCAGGHCAKADGPFGPTGTESVGRGVF